MSAQHAFECNATAASRLAQRLILRPRDCPHSLRVDRAVVAVAAHGTRRGARACGGEQSILGRMLRAHKLL